MRRLINGIRTVAGNIRNRLTGGAPRAASAARGSSSGSA